MSRFIWPVSIRFIHWSLAIIILLNLFVLEEGDEPHKYLGYFGVFLVFIRQFIKTNYKGSNLIARAVHVLIWLCLLGLGISGFMMGLDAFWGDENLENIHEVFSKAMMILIGLHLAGLALHSIRTKTHFWLSMIDGKISRK